MGAKTKIICTMGPSVQRYEKILELIDAGMNVARLNFSHGTHDEHLRVIDLLKKARLEKKVPLAIMLDTKGPEIRIGKIHQGSLQIDAGQKFFLFRPSKKTQEDQITLTPEIVFDSLKEGVCVLLDDGYITTHVEQVTDLGVYLEAKNSGELKSQKGVNIPGVQVPLPAMTEEDRKSITFGCLHDIDIIAASFIRSKEHVLEIRELLQAQGKPDICLISKIENIQGVENFDAILEVSDGIMVARGDLGVEMPLEEVPCLQKTMIRKCYQQGKTVITATQMLESMIKNPRPTRAEVSDVANAIYDSTSAVMLSGETAIGLYPIETVRVMRRIILETEMHFPYKIFLDQIGKREQIDIPSSIALAAVKTAYNSQAKAIFAFTNSGLSARNVSQFRPQIPIFALTSRPKVYHQLAISWGVIPLDPCAVANIQEAFAYVTKCAVRDKALQKGDLVVVTAGERFGIKGTTNMMIVECIP
jgi:pyruvate kinase